MFRANNISASFVFVSFLIFIAVIYLELLWQIALQVIYYLL